MKSNSTSNDRPANQAVLVQFRPFAAVLALFWLPAAAPAQVFIGNLDGVSNSSLFDPGSNMSLPALGWQNVGSTARIFDGAGGNGALIHDTDPFTNYEVQYDTGVAIQPNTTYTLSFDMGFLGGLGATTASYSAQVGTLNAGVFTPLSGGVVSGTATWTGNMTSGFYSPEAGLVVVGPFGSVSGDNLAVRLAQSSNPGPTDFFGFDNVTLSSVPEPREYALAMGGALGAWAWIRRRKKAIAA